MKIKAILLLSLCFIILPLAAKAGNISGWAWSETIGWVSFNSSDAGAGGSYRVEIDTNGNFSGYAWTETIGWISFNRNTTGNPPSDDPGNGSGQIAEAKPAGQIGKSNVSVEGWARALSYGGGWDGWIRFDHGRSNEVYINPSLQLRGWAWGSDVVGWISFNSGDAGAGGNYAVTYSPETHLECNASFQCVSAIGADCPPEGCCTDNDDCCSCTSWDFGPCGDYGTCDPTERRQRRTCTDIFGGTGCDTEQMPFCVYSASCDVHLECNEDRQCVETSGIGTDQCSTDDDCEIKLWRWWESIAR